MDLQEYYSITGKFTPQTETVLLMSVLKSIYILIRILLKICTWGGQDQFYFSQNNMKAMIMAPRDYMWCGPKKHLYAPITAVLSICRITKQDLLGTSSSPDECRDSVFFSSLHTNLEVMSSEAYIYDPLWATNITSDFIFHILNSFWEKF